MALARPPSSTSALRAERAHYNKRVIVMGMWQVSYLSAAEQELETLPPTEQVAIQHAVEKLQLLGIRLPARTASPFRA